MSRGEASVLDIVRAGQRVIEFAVGLSRADLESDIMRLSAILYQIQIVGEATKRLSTQKSQLINLLCLRLMSPSLSGSRLL
jgi:uncharacterized protein with HEPN domain